MINNISKCVAIASLLLFGTITTEARECAFPSICDMSQSLGSDVYLTEHELEFAFALFYDVQGKVAKCSYKDDCRYIKDDYLDVFGDDSNICVPDEFHVLKHNIPCRNKYDYAQLLFKDGYYKEIKEIKQWELDEITDIQIENANDKYGHKYGREKVFTVTAKYENEYVQNHCHYKACGTEKFEIYKGEIVSYKVLDIFIKSEECMKPEMSWPTSKPTKKPTMNNWPTAKPTAKPTENWPTPKPTKKPTMNNWPTAKPTKKPTIAWQTNKPTKKPTIAWTTTKKPMWDNDEERRY